MSIRGSQNIRQGLEKGHPLDFEFSNQLLLNNCRKRNIDKGGGENGEKEGEKKIRTEIVATNIVTSLGSRRIIFVM